LSIRIDPNLRVLLIGGSSNVGKSAVAAALAEQLGWRCVSTDSLARHPGRPWRQSNKKVPTHVADHYLILKANELLESIILHHRKMSPIVAELVKSTVSDTSLPKLVLEGSALWPFITSGPQQKEVAAIWLTASADTLRARIYENSGFANANEQNRAMISRFLERTLLFDRKTAELVNGHGCRVIDVDAYKSAEELTGDIMEHLKMRPKR
jgi:2-phosphoglycerate kinase